MPFDDAKYHAPAAHHDVARVAITASIGMASIRTALEKIASATDIDVRKELDSIQEQSDKLDKYFDDLTGYTPNAG